jgi:hypothetical protein
MRNAKLEGDAGGHHSVENVETPEAEFIEAADEDSELVATIATVAVVGIGAAAFEAALLPGIVIGVAAMWRAALSPANWCGSEPAFQVNSSRCLQVW